MIKTSLIILVIWTFFQGFFSQVSPIFPSTIDLVDEIILLGLTASLIIRLLMGKAKFRRTSLDFLLVILALFVLIASFINYSSSFVSILAIRDTFQYILLFYILVHLQLKGKDLLFLFKMIFSIALFQFFVITCQLFSYHSKTGSLFLEDFADGTFGSHGSHKLGYFMAMMLITSLALYLSKKEKKYLISTLLFSLTLILTSCRGAYFITGAVLIFLYKGYFFKQIKNFLMVAFILFSFFALIFYYNKMATGDTAMINPKNVFSQQLGLNPGTGRRIGVTLYCLEYLKNSGKFFWGISPGKLSKTSLYFPKSPETIDIEILYEDVEFYTILNQLSTTLVEYGIIGFIIICLVFFKVYRTNERSLKMKENPHKNTFGFIFKGVFLIYLLGIFTEKVFEIQEISFYFWFLFSTIYLLNKNKSALKKNFLNREAAENR